MIQKKANKRKQKVRKEILKYKKIIKRERYRIAAEIKNKINKICRKEEIKDGKIKYLYYININKL